MSKTDHHWAIRKLGDTGSRISTGPFGTMLHKAHYVEDGIPLVNPMNIIGSAIVSSTRRPDSGFRKYSHTDVQRIRFIKRAQTLGFNLENIAELLKLDGPQTCDVTHDLAMEKLHLVEEKIAALGLIQGALQSMIRQCELKHKRGTCPIIQSLAHEQAGIAQDAASVTRSLKRPINPKLSGKPR